MGYDASKKVKAAGDDQIWALIKSYLAANSGRPRTSCERVDSTRSAKAAAIKCPVVRDAKCPISLARLSDLWPTR